MKNFEDLENVEIKINYNLLDQSFWNDLSNSISINISNAIKERKSLEPTLEDLHRRFDS